MTALYGEEIGLGAVMAALAVQTPERIYYSKTISANIRNRLSRDVDDDLKDDIVLTLLIMASACGSEIKDGFRRIFVGKDWAFDITRKQIHLDQHDLAGARFAHATFSDSPPDSIRHVLNGMADHTQKTLVMRDMSVDVTAEEAAEMLAYEATSAVGPGGILDLDAFVWHPGGTTPSRIIISGERRTAKMPWQKSFARKSMINHTPKIPSLSVIPS